MNSFHDVTPDLKHANYSGPGSIWFHLQNPRTFGISLDAHHAENLTPYDMKRATASASFNSNNCVHITTGRPALATGLPGGSFGILQKSRILLGGLDIGCLLAFGTLRHFVAYLLAFLERFESVHVDCGKVREQINAAVIGCDKTKSFCIVKPFNCTGCHVAFSLLEYQGHPLLVLYNNFNCPVLVISGLWLVDPGRLKQCLSGEIPCSSKIYSAPAVVAVIPDQMGKPDKCSRHDCSLLFPDKIPTSSHCWVTRQFGTRLHA